MIEIIKSIITLHHLDVVLGTLRCNLDVLYFGVLVPVKLNLVIVRRVILLDP
jgi:hypothetical protein